MTQTDLGNLMRISNTAVGNQEKGLAKAKPESVYPICIRTGMTSDWLFFGNESHMPFDLMMQLRDALSDLAASQPDRRKKGRPRKS